MEKGRIGEVSLEGRLKKKKISALLIKNWELMTVQNFLYYSNI